MKGVKNFNKEHAGGALTGNINVCGLLGSGGGAEDAKKSIRGRNSSNWCVDGEKENVPPPSQQGGGGPRRATTSPLWKCSSTLGRGNAVISESCLAEVPADLSSRQSNGFLSEYVDCLAKDAAELQALRATVKELRLREMRLEGELLELYGLREQEKAFIEMEQKLLEQTAKVSDLETQRKTLLEKVAADKQQLEKDLDCARAQIQELQEQIHVLAEQSAEEIRRLKHKVYVLEAKEDEGIQRDILLETKLQSLRDLEVEVVELRRTSKELQHHKRELTLKLTAMASLAKHSFNAEADAIALSHANQDLCQQLEGLQNDRFSEVEELIYLRWVNACLRYELRSFQSPTGKFTAADLNKNLSPKSLARAKQLMLEYARTDLTIGAREQVDTGYESADSETSSPLEGARNYSETSSDFSGSWQPPTKPGLICRLKKWSGSGKHFRNGVNQAQNFLFSPSVEQERTSTYYTQNRATESTSFSYELPLRSSSDAGSHHVEKNIGIHSPDGFKDLSVGLFKRSASVFSEERDRHKGATEKPKVMKEAEGEQAIKMKAIPGARPGSTSVMFYSGAKQTRTCPIVCRSKEAEVKLEELGVTKRVETTKFAPAKVEIRAPRMPKPPPKPSGPAPGGTQVPVKPGGIVPPPPPPPCLLGPPGAPPAPPRPPPPPPLPPPGGPPKLQNKPKVQRVPEVVQFYQSLMKRDAKKEPVSATSGVAKSTEARNDMIGEIANRSAHLLAIKADVETQREFVESLAKEVRLAAFTNMEDAVAFVKWLDEELLFLVDERAVLKHFDWPEGKADALREAAFEYQDLERLQQKVSVFEDKPELPCEAALNRMLAVQEKMEKSVYAMLRGRDLATTRYKEFSIPTQWMLDSGLVGKIKSGAVRIAQLYMQRVASELDLLSSISEKEPLLQFLLLQGVQFAFRVHQFAGGFDDDSMAAFDALRNRAHLGNSSKS
ncbi:unnamed protein product [Sphagnum jensenii]|uniref:Protein CHUP1, chloroplastic n=1 Tax=Sphagnum jensenii TaxID=128206 RepID=A0ABP0X4R1_9BRYO